MVGSQIAKWWRIPQCSRGALLYQVRCIASRGCQQLGALRVHFGGMFRGMIGYRVGCQR